MNASPKYSLLDLTALHRAMPDEGVLPRSRLKYHPFDLENEDSDKFGSDGANYG
jgi:hypothetical protein